MDLTNDVSNSLNNYFEVISKTGYKPYSEVHKLLVYLFIEEILTGDMSLFITENDYKSIEGAVECLYGTCLIPYPDYRRGMSSEYNPILDQYRISESEVFRNTENNELRVKS